MSIKTVNPFNNKTIKNFEEFSDEKVDQKLETAHKAFAKWRAEPVETRSKLLKNVAKLIRERKQELAELITLEMGKLIKQSLSEIEMCASVYEYYADHAAEFLKDRKVETDAGKAFIRLTPKGIILAIEPWNYPFNQVARLTAPNIAGGNVVVLKHASNVPQCAQMIEKLFHDAGAPEGVFTNLFLSGKKASALAADDRIAGLSLTGSEAAGSSMAESAGKNLKKTVLELGGSDAFVILKDADMDKAIEQAMLGRFANMGQACTSAKRFIVQKEVAKEFTERLKQKITGLKVGDPMDEKTEIGPLSTEEAAKKIAEQVDKTVSQGAKVLIGGKRIDRPGAFYEFTILTDIKVGMLAYSEEIFGPVAAIYEVENEDEAVELANDTRFGLGGVVFSKDEKRAVEVASRIDTGMVFINNYCASRPDLPFGGTKSSGYGTELSPAGIEEFMNQKLIFIAK